MDDVLTREERTAVNLCRGQRGWDGKLVAIIDRLTSEATKREASVPTSKLRDSVERWGMSSDPNLRACARELESLCAAAEGGEGGGNVDG